jgi:hypothetical protein
MEVQHHSARQSYALLARSVNRTGIAIACVSGSDSEFWLEKLLLHRQRRHESTDERRNEDGGGGAQVRIEGDLQQVRGFWTTGMQRERRTHRWLDTCGSCSIANARRDGG